MLDRLLSSKVLTITPSPDFDHFRSIEQLGNATSIPLQWRGFAACFAAVTLRSCSIYLQRTFPRILQTRYSAGGAIVAFGMDDAVSVILDGAEVQQPALMLVKGEASCEFVEPQANLIVFVKFDEIDERGWPGEAGRARLIATRPAALAALRAVTRDILLLASNSADLLQQPRVVDQLEESLLQAVDRAVQLQPPLADGGRIDLGHYLLLVRRLDELLHADPARVLHSADLARELGAPVRTLHNAVMAIRGLSLHRYMRLRRMWSVRQQLVQGGTAESLKAIALANGFWHMGEFRNLYRDLFGESPQETLDAARRQ